MIKIKKLKKPLKCNLVTLFTDSTKFLELESWVICFFEDM